MFDSYLELEDLPLGHKQLAKHYSIIRLSETLAFSLVDTFLVLYLLDIFGFAALGIALSTKFMITALLDFPTGALGDYIGQGRVLRIAYIFLASGALILVFATNLVVVLFAFTFTAIGESQLSGALDSWFDNRYKRNGIDDDKKIYGSFKGRLRGLSLLINALAFILGGSIAEIYDRRLLIFIHFLLILFTLILIIKFIAVKQEVQENTTSKLMEETITKMTTSLRWLWMTRDMLWILGGTAIIFGVGLGIWYNEILFPYYEAYSGTDLLTGILRSINFLIGLIWVAFVPAISKRIAEEYVPYLIANIYANLLFFILTLIYWITIPPSPHFHLMQYLGVILLFQAVGIGDVLTEVFLSRIMIKRVPEHIRNSMYSLYATMITLCAIPASFIGGWVIEQNGIGGGIIITIFLTFLGTAVVFVGVLKSRGTISDLL